MQLIAPKIIRLRLHFLTHIDLCEERTSERATLLAICSAAFLLEILMSRTD